MQLELGAVVTGKVVGITNFGAFVELENGKNCLVHISEISDGYVSTVSEFLKMGQQVKAKIINIDEKEKISLSIKQVNPSPRQKPEKRGAKPTGTTPPPEFFKPDKEKRDFEEMMHSFKQASDEKLLTLKRVAEGKRGAGKRLK